MIDNLSTTVLVFPTHMLTSLTVDEILPSRYLHRSTKFRDLLLKVEMAYACLKHMDFVLFTFTKGPMPPAASSSRAICTTS